MEMQKSTVRILTDEEMEQIAALDRDEKHDWY